ncbi:Bystin [Trichoplax sp. H2]|uniref:Bystin n=1 Tax=Trichoplax adhaerens TaxID=10228 RepID=B3SA57_TRIAD|nr:hypothetical protein TRIADDRAFT_61141 [Trichoplax adhaerens]EDV20462.1 hypothetical protein TRIADDRAFT_61141 [Trichoplax adhaerens]RDD37173.1 Bystin [Trichoplax sp. H2]|eukprot:XP_002117156.1 hypothetical protein TRIADDRAFT_61141 [Trichoplax adhaerens]
MSDKKEQRNRGLADDIIGDVHAKPSGRNKRRKRVEKTDPYVTERLSGKILQQAREQQDEIEEGLDDVHPAQRKRIKKRPQPTTSLGDHFDNDSEADGEANSDEGSDVEISEADLTGAIKLDKEDEKALQLFMSVEPDKRMTLGDFIKEKINEKHIEFQSQMSDSGSITRHAPLDQKLVMYFRKVGELLSKFRSGRLPKPFNYLACVPNWEELVCITEPENWTAAAMYEATRILSSNLTARKVQRFYNLVLLPRVRDDIAEYKRLNYHLYMQIKPDHYFQALKKALFKPSAFFKGILLPLCEARNCSLREAVIIGSILNKTSITSLHACAAILKLTELEYTGANSIFIRILLDKGYTMPYKVIDALVFHFLRFRSEKRRLPVLWHQCFLTFVQRYKEDISSDQKTALLDICEVQKHNQISSEIRREITNSKCRDLEIPEDAMMP